MITTLGELVRPLTETDFLSRLRTGTFTFQPGAGLGRFESLLSWDALRILISRDLIPLKDIQVTIKGHEVPRLLYHHDSKPSAVKMDALLEKGASVIVRHAEKYADTLADLSTRLVAALGEDVSIATIITTGTGGALKLHYDHTDVIVLQLEGSKRWRIYPNPADNLIAASATQEAPTGEPFFGEVLTAGDFMFMPGGYWHHCDNGPQRSVHLGILLQPPTGYHVVRTLLAHLATDSLFRQPLSRFANDADKSALEAVLRAKLMEHVRTMSLAGSATDGRPVASAKDPYGE